MSRIGDIDPEKSLRENASDFGINYNTFRREVSTLEKQGLLVRVSRGRYESKEKRAKEEEKIKEKDYEEMKSYMGNYSKNYSIINKRRWHRLWNVWRSHHEE